MAGIRSLVKDTAVYGLSSIVGRFLNWCLVPLYTIMFPVAEYGVVTYLYSIVALVLIVLIYGMETGYFRFSNHERWPDPMVVYSTSIISLAVSSSLFLALVLIFINPISAALDCAAHPDYIALMAGAVAIDAFTAIPFSRLRNEHRPMRFASLKIINIGLNIGLNLFFILICPWLWEQVPETIAWFYRPDYGIGYIFLTNFIASAATLLLLIPDLRGFKMRFVPRLWREMIIYSFPLLILGIAGIMNQTIDKILLPELVTDKATAMEQVGIYGANYKIAIVMVMFIQAFRFAYEPFIFSRARGNGEDRLQSYRDAMKYFVIFGMLIFLVVMMYLDVLKYFISPRYFSGLRVVPIVMIAELFFGIFFNLSLWYKLTDRTVWGTWFSLLGLGVTLLMNVILVPRMGYMGCAWAALTCYTVMMVASWAVGRVKYPIGYNIGRLTLYFVVALALWGIAILITIPGHDILNMVIRTPLIILYIFMVLRVERITLRSLIPHKSPQCQQN